MVLRALARVAAPSETGALRADSHALQAALADVARRDRLIENLKTRVASLANTMDNRW